MDPRVYSEGSEEFGMKQLFKVTPTTLWAKFKNPPECSKFCSARKLEVAAKTLVF